MDKSSTKNLHVLYVEDDDVARENGIEYLENYFDHVHAASDAFRGLKLYREVHPEIIITDIQMPKLNGLEFIKQIRKENKETQIIVISAYSDTTYLLQAIELQLVKYLIKPVQESAFKEALRQCIESIHTKDSNIINLPDNTFFDMYNQTLICEGEVVILRTKELQMLNLLLKYKNRYVTYSEIEHHLWRESVMSSDALKTVMKNLKAKLPSNIISNLSGTGYKIEC
ncbi:MAG: response regulator [Sulfuricurvum sp.]|uniref:response regulator transcription factor n=1 Tax=Sulfuricurvum sp. TaxID=2025608 RepID=UPI00271E9F86|nr:response regulator [Sulfuricurvum sp.]MDO9056113.1 response regulator [Sulfuricurvum sp.]MDP3292123.1 response regulator [Sulfuricurvum sp.]